MSQMKEQNKTPGKELNKMEASNLTFTKVTILFVRMLSELREKPDELGKYLHRGRKQKKKPVKNKEYNNQNEEYMR